MAYTPFRGIPETCTHERRPGTNICLHCRHAELEAARERRQQLFVRASAVALGITVLVGAGVMGASALRGDAPGSTDSHSVKTVNAAVPGNGKRAARSVPQQPSARQEGRVRPPLASVLPMGTSTVQEGVTAVRSDSDVTLKFDQIMLRTRRPMKFEYWLRTTLPLLYGPAVQPALARIPEGKLASQGELITELPTRGVHIPLDGGWALEVFPITRPARDGPLVIEYRATVVR